LKSEKQVFKHYQNNSTTSKALQIHRQKVAIQDDNQLAITRAATCPRDAFQSIIAQAKIKCSIVEVIGVSYTAA
jgi:hypothetical protein